MEPRLRANGTDRNVKLLRSEAVAPQASPLRWEGLCRHVAPPYELFYEADDLRTRVRANLAVPVTCPRVAVAGT
jgi:hypothetical protein